MTNRNGNLVCKRCGNHWFSPKYAMGGALPVQCPKCKRVDWNKDKKK